MDDPEKNPVSQVLKYVTTLKPGEARRTKGQAIHIRENTPFYAYIVADFTKSLREIATREDFRPTPDGEGFFRFYRNYNCYVEMLSFQKFPQRDHSIFDIVQAAAALSVLPVDDFGLHKICGKQFINGQRCGPICSEGRSGLRRRARITYAIFRLGRIE